MDLLSCIKNMIPLTVKMPREAALDSEFMGLASKLGAEQVSKLQTGFRSYNIYDFVLKLRATLVRQR